MPIGERNRRARVGGPALAAAVGLAIAAVAAAAPAAAADIDEGRKLFNGGFGCSHCHGPNAVIKSRRRDLRRMQKKHKAKADAVFQEAVRNGRQSKGMPSWEGLITPEQLAKIKAFIDSVQKK